MHALQVVFREAGVEKNFSATETFGANQDLPAVGQFVVLLVGMTILSLLHSSFVVADHVAKSLLNVPNNLHFCGGREIVAAFSEDLLQVVGQVATGQVDALNGVGDGETLVDGHGMRNTVARVKHNTCGAAGGVERANALHANVKAGHVENLKHDLSHPFAVLLGVQRRFGHEDRVLFGGDSELVVKRVVPHLLHVVPVSHDSMLNRLLNSKYAALLLGFAANVDFLLVEANHDAGDLGAAHDGGEDRAWGVVSCETSLAHAGAIINTHSGYFLVHLI